MLDLFTVALIFPLKSFQLPSIDMSNSPLSLQPYGMQSWSEKCCSKIHVHVVGGRELVERVIYI